MSDTLLSPDRCEFGRSRIAILPGYVRSATRNVLYVDTILLSATRAYSSTLVPAGDRPVVLYSVVRRFVARGTGLIGRTVFRRFRKVLQGPGATAIDHVRERSCTDIFYGIAAAVCGAYLAVILGLLGGLTGLRDHAQRTASDGRAAPAQSRVIRLRVDQDQRYPLGPPNWAGSTGRKRAMNCGRRWNRLQSCPNRGRQ